MRVFSVALLALMLPGCATTHRVRPATYEDLREGEKIAGMRYYFTTTGRYRVEGDFYEMREALNAFEAPEAQARGDITGFEIDTDNDFWRYEGIAGGDLYAIEFIVDDANSTIAGVLAEPRYPERVVGYEAKLAHLGLTLGEVIHVGERWHVYEGRHRNFVLARTSDPVLLAGLDARGGEVDLAWIVRVTGDGSGDHQGLAWMLDLPETFEDFRGHTRRALLEGKPDWDWLESAVPTYVAAAVRPEGEALSREVQEVVKKEAGAAQKARAAAGTPGVGAWMVAAQREARALATLARLRPLAAEERAPLVAGFEALAGTIDTLAARDPAGGGAALRAGAVYARALAEDAAKGDARALAALPRSAERLVPLLDALADTPEPAFSRADRLVADLDVVAGGHADDPRVAALAAPTFALLESWAAAWEARGLVASAVWLRLGVDHAAGRIHEHAKFFRDTMFAEDRTGAQRDALRLFGRVMGAPSAGSYAAPAFAYAVDRVEMLRRDRGARVFAKDTDDIAWLAKEAGGPELVFERGPVKADVGEGVKGFAVTETRTRAVEVDVDTTEAYAAREAGLAEIEAHLAWIEVERAKILSDMPPAVRDDQVVLDRVTGMAIGPNTGSGKYLNQKREGLQDRLDSLETSRQVSIERYRRLTGTVPADTRTEYRTETVERTQNVLVYKGMLTARHRLEGGGASSTFTHIRDVTDTLMKSYPEKKDLIASETKFMQERLEEKELLPLIRRWLDARLEVVLAEGQAAHGWTEEELAAERATLTTMFVTRSLPK